VSDHVMIDAEKTVNDDDDDDKRKKQKTEWITHLSKEMGLAPEGSYVTSQEEREAALGDYFDKRTDEENGDMEWASDTPVKKSEDDETPKSSEDSDDSDEDDVGEPCLSYGKGKRKRNPEGSYKDEDPAPAFQFDDPEKVLSLKSGTDRSHTAYGWGVNPTVAKKGAKKPPKTSPAMPVTDDIRKAYQMSIDEAKAREAHAPTLEELFQCSEFFAVEDDGSSIDDRVKSFSGKQGPHTMAHVALDCIMHSVMPADTDAYEDRVSRLEWIFTTCVDSPKAVMEIVKEEVSAEYEEDDKGDKGSYYNDKYQKRLNDYVRTYVEVFNDVEASFAMLKDKNTDAGSEKTKAVYGHVKHRIDELLNLHPYATYAWQRGGRKATKGEIAGGGERGDKISKALDDLKNAGTDPKKREVALDDVAKSLVNLLDGVEAFHNTEKFESFLINQRLILIDDWEPNAMHEQIKQFASQEKQKKEE
jgi:hypothetical protein